MNDPTGTDETSNDTDPEAPGSPDGPDDGRPDAEVEDIDGIDDGLDEEAWSALAADSPEGQVGADAVPTEEGQLAYDCAAWAGETRGLLKSLLVTHGITHAWQGTTLTIRGEDEEEVDRLVDEVAGSARPALDPDAAKVVYEVAEWPVALQTQLADDLARSDIPYEWDERGDLVVLEADEEQVGLILDELPEPGESGISSDDGVAVHEVLDSVFMSTDRLVRNGDDAAGTVRLAESAEVLEQLAVPFGFEPGEWRRLVGAVEGLRRTIAGEAPEHGSDDADAQDGPLTGADISDMAREVRELVRRYV